MRPHTRVLTLIDIWSDFRFGKLNDLVIAIEFRQMTTSRARATYGCRGVCDHDCAFVIAEFKVPFYLHNNSLTRSQHGSQLADYFCFHFLKCNQLTDVVTEKKRNFWLVFN